MEEPFVRGRNWAPDSHDDGEESEIRFVMDSLAGETEVPDSQDNSDVESRRFDAAFVGSSLVWKSRS
ncbi:hypothetical protein BS78_02G344000 [Paspalum vaginatum]|nr:hypothetical protein BS78_02G344000 [Paspalum vaginatum]